MMLGIRKLGLVRPLAEHLQLGSLRESPCSPSVAPVIPEGGMSFVAPTVPGGKSVELLMFLSLLGVGR